MSESERDRILELFSARLDGELTAEEEAELERALAESPELVREAEGLESTVAWLTEEGARRVPGDRAEPGFAASVMDRIGDGASDGDEASDEDRSGSVSAPPVPATTVRRGSWRRPSRWLPLVSLAASILLAVVFVVDSMRPPTGHFEADSMAKGDGLAEAESPLVVPERAEEYRFDDKGLETSGSTLGKRKGASSWDTDAGTLGDGSVAAEEELAVARVLEKNARSADGALRSLGYASDQGDAARADDDEIVSPLEAGASLSARDVAGAARGLDGAGAAGDAAGRGTTAAADEPDAFVTASDSVVLEVRLAQDESAADLDWLSTWEAQLDDTTRISRYEAPRQDEAETTRRQVSPSEGVARSRPNEEADASDRRVAERSKAARETQGLAKKSAEAEADRAAKPRAGAAERGLPNATRERKAPGSARSGEESDESKQEFAPPGSAPLSWVPPASGSSRSEFTRVVFDRDLTPGELARLERAFEARGIPFRRVALDPQRPARPGAAGGGASASSEVERAVVMPDTRITAAPSKAPVRGSAGSTAANPEAGSDPPRGVREAGDGDTERIRVTIRLSVAPPASKSLPTEPDEHERR